MAAVSMLATPIYEAVVQAVSARIKVPARSVKPIALPKYSRNAKSVPGRLTTPKANHEPSPSLRAGRHC